jgi:FecR protein
MSRRSGTIDEGFDAGHPVAEALRSLLPADGPMSDEARDRLMARALEARRVARRSRRRHARPRLRTAAVAAGALVTAAIIAVAVLLPIYGGSGRSVSARNARLDSVQGNVSVMAPNGDWRSAANAVKLSPGSRVRTGEGSTVSVVFPDESIMRVSDDSEAVVKNLDDDAVSVVHVSGSTYHRVHPGTRYTVSNSDVTSRALGTAFNVENRKPGDLEILSVENAVEVEISEHEPIKVAEGEVMVVSMEEGRKAEKSPVSRERLADSRLRDSVRKDEEKGYSTGIYEKLDVSIAEEGTPDREAMQEYPITLVGTASTSGADLQWTVEPGVEFAGLVLLRSEVSEPVFPDHEIARYADTSIGSASDDSAARGRTYQYRLAALSESGEPIAYSNTLVMSVAAPASKPEPVSVNLSGTSRPGGVSLEWSVAGASRFTGFVLERVVEKAPGGSPTPAGSTSSRRIDSRNVFFTFVDNSVAGGHTYTYRVGIVVDGAVMAYSKPVTLVVEP